MSEAYSSQFSQLRLRTLTDYGNLLLTRGYYESATRCFSQALELNPESAECHCNIAAAKFCSGDAAGAVEQYLQVELRNSLDCDTLANLGTAYLQIGDFDAATERFEQALILDPDFAEGHLYQAFIRLSRGELAEGWNLYEWRLRLNRWNHRTFAVPRWYGQVVHGDRVLIHAEQGLGDTLQFLRYIPMVATRGATAVLEVQRELLSVLGKVEGANEIRSAEEIDEPVSWHCPLLSLPLAFATQLDTIPPVVSFLSRPELVSERWKSAVSQFSGLKVGLCWAGNPKHQLDRFRSIGLRMLVPLLHVDGVKYFSLQKGSNGESMANLYDPGWCDSLPDTVAAIECLDLVITVDTMIAHLAGTIGKPVWILLPFVSDFRWMVDREASPWYPTARLFRQPKPGDWESAVAAVACALEKWVRA